MPKFEKQYVHFMWDDELKGKYVFCADSINVLIDSIRFTTSYKRQGVASYSGDMEFPFCADDSHWRFVYYDPYYDLKLAREQGKVIQRYWNSSQEWEEYIYDDFPDDISFYRIKPEEQMLVTCCELAQWLAQGSGEWSFIDGGTVSANYVYSKGHENNLIAETIRIRKWGDSEWHEPTREYMGL